ncbi:MAG: hypothetical protein CMJ48_05615 [Planctomycetaceae bacterium]|nr:hypothetical protein [Planctomycetaceae bacterium]
MFGQQQRSVLPCLTVVFLVVSLAAGGLVGCSSPVPSPSPVPAPELLAAARGALRESDFRKVEELVEEIPRGVEEWQAGQLLAGEAASKDGRPDAALAYYLDAAQKDDSTADGQLALFSAGEVYLELGQLSRAEQIYRKILKRQPGNGLTNERMAFLLSITARRWESLKHYFVLIQGGDADFLELGIAGDVGRHIEQPEFLRKCRERFPQGKLVRLALATHAFDEGEPEARALLESLLVSFPELIPAHAMLGELLVNTSDDVRFINWHASLPPIADDSPNIWFVRGLWARKQSDLKTAANCLWQTVVRTPFHRRAFYVLGQVLVALKDPRAEEVSGYSKLLIDLSQSIDRVLASKGDNPLAVRDTMKLLEQLGRIWETCAWGVIARQRFPEADWPHEILGRHGHKLGDRLPWIEPDKNPVADRRIADVPQFGRLVADVSKRRGSGRVESGTRSLQAAARAADIHFEEAHVIAFEYFNGDDPETKGVRTFEQTGGGVAVLDFDLDGAPDVFLPQGSEWETGAAVPTPSSRYRDRLFHNVAGREFRDVSDHLSGLDSGFGQGCAVGDFNNDGFPDLYVANVGRNCLYENMGDGTFSNVTQIAGLSDNSWTVSAMICDLNADGLPDIFDVNYLRGKGVYEMICAGRACSPSVFSGAPDRMLINQGDGRFVAVADATPPDDSKGMGVVAFEMEADRRPVLFIANDQVANCFLSNQPAGNSHNIRLSDDATIKGLAYNDDGLPMGCMGIAADDWNGDNLIDLFVTNFQDEPNTLYLQDSPGFFVDTSKASGLYAASIPLTGWGTQALDADLDGLPDLVVANGHVDDYRDEGGPYHMQPQFFRNVGGRFQEVNADKLGAWFGEKYLGRGLARVDWNRDGLPDFIVSNMNSSLGVMKNTSVNTGHFLRVRLHATETARDAIGARVTLRTAGRLVTRQLMAGDGYMASNERVVAFGLGDSDGVDEVSIGWPSGATSNLKSPPVDSTLIVVEGSTLATRFDSSHSASFIATSTTEAKP